MPEFAYVARDFTGKKVVGTVSAGSQREAISQLDAKSLFPIEVTVTKGTTAKRSGRVSGQVMANVYAQMASLLRSGVPMIRTITVLAKQSNNRTLNNVLEEVRGRVEEGESLGVAMARYPRVFSDMAVNMVKAGAEGGFLEDALERVAAFTEQQEDLKGKTGSALAYPVFLGTVGGIVVLVLLMFFVPQFDSMFASMREKGALPVATDWLLTFSVALQNYWWIAAILIGVGLTALSVFLKTEEGKWWRDWVKIKTPGLGRIFLNLAVSRFCRVLGTLLINGVPILRALDISKNAAGNRILSEAVTAAGEAVSAGERLATPLAASGHFPGTVIEMISVAEESNSLDKVLVQISNNLESRTFRQLELFVRLIEPLMLLILAAIVMFVVLALMVPILTQAKAL